MRYLIIAVEIICLFMVVATIINYSKTHYPPIIGNFFHLYIALIICHACIMIEINNNVGKPYTWHTYLAIVAALTTWYNLIRIYTFFYKARFPKSNAKAV